MALAHYLVTARWIRLKHFQMTRDVHSTPAINAPKFLCDQVWASLLQIQEHMIQSLCQQV